MDREHHQRRIGAEVRACPGRIEGLYGCADSACRYSLCRPGCQSECRPEGRPIDCRLFEELMRRDFTVRKRIILGSVTLLVLADVALAANSWELSAAPRTVRQSGAVGIRPQDLFRADIKRI